MEDIVFCKGGGCTAKLGADVLKHILSKIPKGEKDISLLVGYDSSDDAAVYRISDDMAIVQTLDFFPPMVDDPYIFGQIAAANALSDVYAMRDMERTNTSKRHARSLSLPHRDREAERWQPVFPSFTTSTNAV